MTAVAFDTLKFVRRLKEAGVPSAQAEAEAEVLAEIFETNLSELATKRDLKDLATETKRDLKDLETALNTKIEKGLIELTGKITLLQWMFGVVITGIAALLVKAFFH